MLKLLKEHLIPPKTLQRSRIYLPSSLFMLIRSSEKAPVDVDCAVATLYDSTKSKIIIFAGLVVFSIETVIAPRNLQRFVFRPAICESTLTVSSFK